MNKEQLYKLRNSGERILWMLVVVAGLVSFQVKSFQVALGVLIGLVALYEAFTCLYFKKSPIFRAVSAKSKVAIVGTYVFSVFLLWLAYFILSHS